MDREVLLARWNALALAGAGIAAVLLFLAGPASGSSVAIKGLAQPDKGLTLSYQAGQGETNSVRISGATVSDSGAGLDAGPGCTQVDLHTATCLTGNVTNVKIATADGDDSARFDGDVRAQLDGGGGNDILIGGAGSDTLRGRAGNDQLVGRGGKDMISAGPGDDEVFGVDGIKEKVVCGRGDDHGDWDSGMAFGSERDTAIGCEHWRPTLDQFAPSIAGVAAEALETCATDYNGVYSSCTMSDLYTIEPTLAGSGPALTVESSSNGYEVAVHSSINNDYRIVRQSNGVVDRTCTAAGYGYCPSGGSW